MPEGSPHKLDNRCRSLERHDAIARASQAVGAMLVHPIGQPISQSANSGFNRRREPWGGGDDAGPSGIGGAGGEKLSACQFSMSIRLCPSFLIIWLPSPFTIRAVGVAQFAAMFGSGVSPFEPVMFGPPFAAALDFGVLQLRIATENSFPSGPLLFWNPCGVGH